MIVLYVVGGFALLLIGGEFLVRGSVALARRLRVSPFLIGLTFVAYGTSAPELVVSLEAALADAPGLAVGNVVGSNIANILLVLGVAGVISAVKSDRRLLARDLPVMMIAAILFIVFARTGRIEVWHGAVMLVLLAGFTAYSYLSERRHHTRVGELREKEGEEVARVPSALWLTLFFLLGGLIAVIGGAYLLVEGSVTLARSLGISEVVIGLTLVAVGSSLPELATTIVAAYRHHGEVAFGNILGSCIFNILGIMGLVSLAMPLQVAPKLQHFDLWVMLGVLALPVLFTLLGWRLTRPGGLLFLAAYAAYVYIQFAQA